MISVLRSAFLFSSLSQIPASFLLFVWPLYNPRWTPLPVPTSGFVPRVPASLLIGCGAGVCRELANQKLSSAPAQHYRLSVPCAADILSRDRHAVMGWVERGLSREACEERGSRQERIGTTEANLALRVPLS